jgi:hypothetical protein
MRGCTVSSICSESVTFLTPLPLSVCVYVCVLGSSSDESMSVIIDPGQKTCLGELEHLFPHIQQDCLPCKLLCLTCYLGSLGPGILSDSWGPRTQAQTLCRDGEGFVWF